MSYKLQALKDSQIQSIPTSAGRGDRKPHTRLILIALCSGYFMVILDITAVNVALSSIQARLGATVSDLQWIIDGYSLVFASFLLTGGILGDRLGAKRTFLAGVALFTLASALCGLAPTLLALQLFRLLQGLGGALLVPASLALISQAFSGPAERARAIGTWGAIAGIAAASGPVIGGLLVSILSWRSVFLINVPVGVLSIGLTLHFVAQAPRQAHYGLDLPAQVVAVLGLGALTFALIEGPSWGWISPPIIGAGLLFGLATVAFILRERQTASPMLPLKLFGHSTFLVGNVVGLLLNFGFYGQLFLVSLYLPRIQGYSPLLTGLALLPESAMAILAPLLAGRLTGYRGPRLPMALGLAIGGLGMLGMSWIGANTSYLLIWPTLLFTGFGVAFTMPAMTTAVIASAPDERSSTASAVLNASRQVGQVLGIALLGSLVSGQRNFLPGMHIALLIAGAVFLSGSLLSWRYVHH